MKPNDTQLSSLLAAAEVPRIRATEAKYRFQILEAVIAQWEAIRPKEDTQLRRTNHALAAELADVKARLASAESGERAANSLLNAVMEALHRYHLALDRREGTYLAADKFAADVGFALGRPWVYGNAKRREEDNQPMDAAPTPKPTPKEIERREFESWLKTAGHQFTTTLHESWMFEGWKAARATPTTPAS